MIPRPPISTRTDNRVPYTTLVRSYKLGTPNLRTNAEFLAASAQSFAPRRFDHVAASHFGVVRDILCRPNSFSHERTARSEEHTSELQSLMRNSYAVFCLTNKQHYHNMILELIHRETIAH